MKASYDNFNIEGTPQEIAAFFAAISNNNSNIINKSTRTVTSNPGRFVTTVTGSGQNVTTTTSNGLSRVNHNTTVYPVSRDAQFDLDEESQRFLSALYYYEPNRLSSTGRGALLAKILLTKRAYAVRDLKRLANSKNQTVRKTILRMQAAGCSFSISSTRLSDKVIVQMTSMGTIEQASATYQATLPNGNVPNQES